MCSCSFLICSLDMYPFSNLVARNYGGDPALVLCCDFLNDEILVASTERSVLDMGRSGEVENSSEMHFGVKHLQPKNAPPENIGRSRIRNVQFNDLEILSCETFATKEYPSWKYWHFARIVYVQINDLAILEVSKEMLPCWYRKTNASFDMGGTFLPQFSPGEDGVA
ncbi:hypothetical protein JHK82_053952 [Glycine max]|nr:hypothetical protein JHK86_053801 [Glycine max]KAG5083787.1 hypothetical protein JHK84_053825 [Glycine max]KAG5086555.1 hypothetical protein JHK82_053952 [Glycine max]